MTQQSETGLRERGLSASTSVRQVPVSAAVRALSTLSRVDYGDAFLVDTGRARDWTAEQWARGILEDAPITVRRTLLSGWSALGLRLDPARSDRCVLGWTIRVGTPELVLLGADSHIGMPAELLVKRERDALLFSTFVQHADEAARAVWMQVEPVHVPIVRRMLEQASRRWHT